MTEETEQQQTEQTKPNENSKARKFFLVLFEDCGTEKEKIISDCAESFYNFAKEELKALEKCQFNLGGSEEIEIKIEDSGVRVLKVFELNEKTGFSIDVKSSYAPLKEESVEHEVKEDDEKTLDTIG